MLNGFSSPKFARTRAKSGASSSVPGATAASACSRVSPGFCPTGPWLVTPDEVDHRSLRLRSWVNGEPRQDSSTADMVFDVEHLVWDLSQYLTLEPGDLVLTGTPQGVALSGRFPYLAAGDVVELEIEGLGRQRQVMVHAAG